MGQNERLQGQRWSVETRALYLNSKGSMKEIGEARRVAVPR
jgi:hypothetical protein